MADIFISYSKPDRDLTLKLAAYLQSEGWSVWWDKSLGAGDAYRDEIMKQLAVARAVITIWSKNSIQSDWVRAESGRAKADGKLIPVKTADVTYPDIPLPFGEMHTENFGATELIRAAVVAQLSKPTVPPSFFRQITSAFKYHALTWIGIIGGTITLFTNLREFLYLAVASFLFLIFAGCLLFAPLLMQAKTLMPPPIVTVDDGDERTPEQLEEDLQRQVETGAKQLRYYELAIEMPILLLFQFLWMSAVLLSPLKKLTHRLTFVVVGVFALFLLNELSKFNLHEYLVPPSGRGHEQ
jgi:hypothetical protein